MPWSSAFCLPAVNQIVFYASESNAFAQGWMQKFIPRNFDGTIFDCSAAGSPSLLLDNGQQGVFRILQAPTTNLITADASGITVEIDGTAVATLGGLLGTSGGNYSLIANDGTSTELCLAEGRWQIVQSP